MSKYVLQTSKIPRLNINKLKTYVNKYIDIRKDYYLERKSNLKIESSFSEWWIEKCTNGIYIGSDNKSFDVLSDKNKIDCISLCINSNLTNEKSVIQNFMKCGNELDILFRENKDSDIVDIFTEQLLKKFISDESGNIYYAVFISDKIHVHFVSFIVNTDALCKLKSDGFTKRHKSIYVKNFISKEDGTAKIYKSKKRFEVRFTRNILKYSIKLY